MKPPEPPTHISVFNFDVNVNYRDFKSHGIVCALGLPAKRLAFDFNPDLRNQQTGKNIWK
jgi:hypothetical protein